MSARPAKGDAGPAPGEGRPLHAARAQEGKTGGEGGIRTHGTRKGTAIFETARFNHSRTSPRIANDKGLLPEISRWDAGEARSWVEVPPLLTCGLAHFSEKLLHQLAAFASQDT